jgi:hypothetical protein
MRLFGRKWSVQVDRETFDDFDMSFSVVKTTKAEPNTCELVLYNLSADKRGKLSGTPLVKIASKSGPAKHQHKGIPVRISAGYEDADSVVWQGDLRTVESKKSGPDWATQLGSGDGEEAFQRSRVNLSFGPNTQIATVIQALAKAMGIGVGNLPLYLPRILKSPAAGQLGAHGLTISSSAATHLSYIAQSVGLEWSIQDGVLQFTERGLPVLGQVVLVSPSSGMVDEPSIDNEGVLTVKMLMIPNVVPGSVIRVESADPRGTGNFRIEKATYEGDSFGNPWHITCECKPY